MAAPIGQIIEGAKKVLSVLEKARKTRDSSVNNERTRREGIAPESPGSHIPNPDRDRQDILDELTGTPSGRR